MSCKFWEVYDTIIVLGNGICDVWKESAGDCQLLLKYVYSFVSSSHVAMVAFLIVSEQCFKSQIRRTEN